MKNISFLHQLKLTGNDRCATKQQRKGEILKEDASPILESVNQVNTENVDSNLLKLNFKLIDIDTAFGN